MSHLHWKFFEGSRSEYLAQYIFTAIGTYTPVAREQDHGFDALCYLKEDVNSELLTFRTPFIVQIKSDSNPYASYGKLNSKSQWVNSEIQWLNQQQIPLLFGWVNKSLNSISIYGGSAYQILVFKGKRPAQIRFRRGNHRGIGHDISDPEEHRLSWPENAEHDGVRYTVDLGDPLVTLDLSLVKEVKNNSRLNKRIDLIRKYLDYEQKNILLRNQGIDYRYWITQFHTNESFKLAGGMGTKHGAHLPGLSSDNCEFIYARISLSSATLQGISEDRYPVHPGKDLINQAQQIFLSTWVMTLELSDTMIPDFIKKEIWFLVYFAGKLEILPEDQIESYFRNNRCLKPTQGDLHRRAAVIWS